MIGICVIKVNCVSSFVPTLNSALLSSTEESARDERHAGRLHSHLLQHPADQQRAPPAGQTVHQRELSGDGRCEAVPGPGGQAEDAPGPAGRRQRGRHRQAEEDQGERPTP